jgi:hypothetical protein
MRWVQLQLNGLTPSSVLEVGSLNVNGSVRGLFDGVAYTGIDMQEGPGVDVVMNAHDLGAKWDREFDLIICTEMLEHDNRPWTTLMAMADVAQPGCQLILTCRGFDERGSFQFHAYPHDYWRYTIVGLTELLRLTGWDPLTVLRDPAAPGVFATARRAA